MNKKQVASKLSYPGAFKMPSHSKIMKGLKESGASANHLKREQEIHERLVKERKNK